MNPAESERARFNIDKKEKRKKRKGGPGEADEKVVSEKQMSGEDAAGPKRKMTVSIAVAGSIIDNAQSLELATLLAGQIARAATVFRIDEVVVFDSNPSVENGGDGEESGARFLVRILEYLETPQYLRRRLFPMHKNLKFVGLLPPLDAPHHVRKHEWSEFREGVTLDGDRSKGTLVDVGLSKSVLVEQILEPGKRVTVAMGTDRDILKACVRKVVPPSSPKDEMELYWGYKVRYASNLSRVFSDSQYKEGYDYIIGTSEHGKTISSSELNLPSLRHLLIAFGGLAGLEESIEEDRNLKV
ncbi:hypothetical protein GUJ93_ZPchr0008g12116 [Zizania palustris]|uniref:Uncharacterized protein n=1 Tax=Zizania palustris TaxID=103762 RepID=A0A8J5R3K2_ZIZPA|nr:hypothetical protein GUJ93_ZPchr0008g12116 [Zizania palustris]KAG8045087.1 hypothetical protein GUJ93_ZPchr0008g12116 [Zizania palustris]